MDTDRPKNLAGRAMGAPRWATKSDDFHQAMDDKANNDPKQHIDSVGTGVGGKGLDIWWNGQNLEKPIKGVDGRLWHFRVWHDHVSGVYTQRIYYWDEDRKNTGCAEFAGDQILHITKLKQRIRKIVTDSSYRDQFQRQLDFPIERHYP